MSDLTAIYRDDATFEEQAVAYQALIDSGEAWHLEGYVGRTATDLIEQGYCTLGPKGHCDYWGSYIPSRDEVEPDSKGSLLYAQRLQPDFWSGRWSHG